MTIKNIAESAVDTQVDVPHVANTFEIRAVEPATVRLALIKRDEALSCRARGIDARTVAEYAEAMQAGASFPPVVLFKDAKAVHWLADGFHRTAAAELAGQAEVQADVREGGRRDALIFAASANSAHGLRRTNADKRHAVVLVLASFSRWSDRKVAEACGVDHKTVARLRSPPTGEVPQQREGADGKARTLPSFDVDRELARLEKSIGALVDRWPADDAEGRARLRLALDGWSERLGRTTTAEPQPVANPTPAKGRVRANGAAVAPVAVVVAQ